MNIQIALLPQNGGAFNCLPARTVEISDELILTDNVILPWDFNPHKVRLWCISNEFGALGCVWASCEQDALDALCDADLAGGLLVDEKDYKEEEAEDLARIGNAGELANLDHCTMQLVRIDRENEADVRFLCRLAEARGAAVDNLGKL